MTLHFPLWFKNSEVTDEFGNPLVVHRGEYGPVQQCDHGNCRNRETGLFQTRQGALSFGSANAANVYALNPNRQDDFPISPRITSAYLSIKKPLMNRPDDPFIELGDIAKNISRNFAMEISLAMKGHITNTCRWCDDIGKDFENFDEYFHSSAFDLSDLYFDAYALFDEHRYVAVIKKAGFDGAIHGGSGATFGEAEFKVFTAKQVWLTPCVGIFYEKLAR